MYFTGRIRWYNNDDVHKKIGYGALYNHHAVKTGKLAPTGWHVATRADWDTLENFLGGSAVAGGKLKYVAEQYEIFWNDPNVGATDEVGFSAKPGGVRLSGNGTFKGQREEGDWWTFNGSLNNGYSRRMYNYSREVFEVLSSKRNGKSVRCVKD